MSNIEQVLGPYPDRINRDGFRRPGEVMTRGGNIWGSGGNIWGSGRDLGDGGPRSDWHLLQGVAHGVQVAQCGQTVEVGHTYHCDPESGPYARPCIGDVCVDCDALLDQREERDADDYEEPAVERERMEP